MPDDIDDNQEFRVEEPASIAVDFLQRLRPGGPWLLVAIEPDGKAIGRTCADAADVERFVAANNGRKNLYYSVAETRGIIHKKATKKDVTAVNFLWTEIDPDLPEQAEESVDGAFRAAAAAAIAEQKEQALARLRAFVPSPTMLIDSGNGIQAGWQLESRHEINGAESVKAIEDRNKFLLEQLGGDASAFNVDRILRLPGTTNLPTAKKRKQGKARCETSLIEFNDSSYSLNEFFSTEQRETSRTAPDGDDSPLHRLNAAALADLDAWVPELFGDGARRQSTGGYRVSSAALGRDLEEDLSIHPEGIRDFGVADQGDPQQGRRTAVEVVMKHGRKTFDDAVAWMQQRLGIEDDTATEIAEVNREFALVIAGNKAAVMKFEGGSNFRLIQVGAFKAWLANRRVRVGRKVRSLGDHWVDHRARRQYEGIEFAPGGGRQGYYNLWRGFAVEPREGDCSKFLAHLKDNVAQGDENLYRWVVSWFAQIFQQPAVKLGTSLVARGKMGVGKTKVGQVFGSLIGDDHYALIADPRYITGQFNSHMASLLLLQADEAFWAGDKRAEGKLKDMVTGDRQFIEFKGVDPIRVDNYVRLFVCGNQNWLVPAGFAERRFAVLDVGEAHMQDIPYFAAIDEEMRHGGREALLHHLLTFDLARVNLRVIPKTTALLEQQIQSTTPEQAWWLDTLKRGELPWGANEPRTCLKAKLYRHYIRHTQLQGVRHRAIETTIGMFLTKYVGSELITKQMWYTVRTASGDQKKRGYCFVFPPLAECRERFAREMQQEMDWGDIAEWYQGDPIIENDDQM